MSTTPKSMENPGNNPNEDLHRRPNGQLAANLPPGSDLVVTVDHLEAGPSQIPPGKVEVPGPAGQSFSGRVTASLAATGRRLVQRIIDPASVNAPLLASWALGLYLLTRLVGLGSFPPSFTSGEAASAVLGADLLHARLVDSRGVFLPAWMAEGDGIHGTGVYLQLLFYLLFSQSVFIVRIVNVLAGFLCAWALYRILQEGWQLKAAWSAPLVLSLSAAWFILSRSGFDMALLASLYALSLLYYLRYRNGSSRAIYPSVLCWALTFYTSPAGEVLALATLPALAALDARWHWKHRATNVRAGLLLLLFLIPWLRQVLVPGDLGPAQLLLFGSSMLQDIPFTLRLAAFGRNLAGVLDPLYWVIPGQADPALFRAPGYANFVSLLFPCTLWGLWNILRTLRKPASRLLLVLLVLCSLPAGFWGPRLPYSLPLVLPLALLTSLGLGCLLGFVSRARPTLAVRLEIVLFPVLGLASIVMANDLLLNGPGRIRDYSRQGIQYGAQQVYDRIGRYRIFHPEEEFCLSNTWAEDPEVLRRFFARKWTRFGLCEPERISSGYEADLGTRLFAWTSDDLEVLEASGHFSRIETLETVPCPDGQPCFRLVRLEYRQDIEQVLDSERAARTEPLAVTVVVDGESLDARHSPLDIGTLQNAFDKDDSTVIRTLEANPLVIELDFPRTRPLQAVSVVAGSEPVTLSAAISQVDASPAFFRRDFDAASTENQLLRLDFGRPLEAESLHLELTDTQAGTPAHVHLWEVYLE